MRLGVARRAGNPLAAYFILRCRKPFLRQDLYQSGLQVENKERKGRSVVRHCFITGGNDQLVDGLQFRGHINFVRARWQRDWYFKVGYGRGDRINAVSRLLEPAGDLRQIEGLKLVRIKASQANAAPLGTPNAEEVRWHKKRPAVCIQRQARLVRFLLRRQRYQISDGALFAVMCPDEALAGDRVESGESLPVPGRRADGRLDLLAEAGGIGCRHRGMSDRDSGESWDWFFVLRGASLQVSAGIPSLFTFARMNFTMSSIAVPGWKMAATPAFLRPSMSWSGMMPPTITSTSSILFCLSRSISRGTMTLCAPERIDSPVTRTSSCSAALTIISGVWRNPV